MEINEMIEMNEGEPMAGDAEDVFTGSFEAGMGETQVICGIAAMEKKCSSKPMQQVGSDLDGFVFPKARTS